MTALPYSYFDQPTEVHGFTIEMGVGDFPPGANRPTGRFAFYAWLSPATPENRAKMKRAGKANIQAYVEITPLAAKAIREDPMSIVAEKTAVAVLAQASRLAKIVEEA